MQITNAELAKNLNDQLELVGVDAITVNVIRQWVAWDVLPKATAKGRTVGQRPEWSRSDMGMNRALRLGALRKLGIRRENALISQAYLEWGHPDFTRAQCALASEWRKWTSQLARHQTTFLGNADFGDLSRTQKRAMQTQLGPLDNVFRGTMFEQSPELYAASSELARIGSGNPEKLTELMTVAFFQMAPELHNLIPADLIPNPVTLLSGIIGISDEIENSGEIIIENASERELNVARYRLRFLRRQIQKSSPDEITVQMEKYAPELVQMLRFLGPQIFTGPWLISLFVLTLKSVVNNYKCAENSYILEIS